MAVLLVCGMDIEVVDLPNLLSRPYQNNHMAGPGMAAQGVVDTKLATALQLHRAVQE